MQPYRLCSDTPSGDADCDEPLVQINSLYYCCPLFHGRLIPSDNVDCDKVRRKAAAKWKRKLPQAERRGTYNGKTIYAIENIPHVITGSTDHGLPIEPGEIAATIRLTKKTRVPKTLKQIALPPGTMVRLRFTGGFKCDGQ